MDWHDKFSLAKSITRVIGYVLLPFNLWIGAFVLIAAEGLGLIEEL
jgi:hypothetical protein